MTDQNTPEHQTPQEVGTEANPAIEVDQRDENTAESKAPRHYKHELSDDPEGETPPAAARAVGLFKQYGKDETSVTALDHVDVAFVKNQFTAIMGPSGSGKSTLMHCMAGLDSASGGSAFIGDTDLSQLRDKEMTALRRDRLGFIFQSFNLVPTLTAAENITLPSDIAGREVDQEWFEEITNRLGLADRLTHRPAELSGGQQQRVACARALVSRPEIIFGDEPTGNLDSNSSREVLDILRTAVDQDGQTVVIVTHDAKAASYADRVVFLADGRLVKELHQPGIDEILAYMAGIES
ncbi:Bacitracin export ATP-binding protein BceA [Corynebacterium atrinae]|uniref:ABC transporter ATP-binding protein n=1 Tax=Corynebacterium atrinae TaxID=1336740 RepID=UPI0025B4B9C5|nr:ABC transporter ATP-binding protein [Corynebacterium atrinae]WJY64242.1 Bacitracin export ATP-binding protein BceA [Corynebacterium atrinae]